MTNSADEEALSTETNYSPAVYDAIYFDALGGNDTITVYGTSSVETAGLSPGSVSLTGPAYQVQATSVETSYAYGGIGDTATLTGAANAPNRFYSYADYSLFTETRRSFYFYVRGFDDVTATSSASLPAYAYLYDSPGVDAFSASTTSAAMNREDPWSDTIASGFARIYAYSTAGGADTAVLNGSAAGGNNYRGYPAYSTLYDSSQSFYHYVRGFHSVTAAGSKDAPSSDRAYLYDSPGNDTFDESFLEEGKYQGASLTDAGDSYQLWIKYFDLVYARSTDSGTNDTIAVEDEELLAYRLLRMGTW